MCAPGPPKSPKSWSTDPVFWKRGHHVEDFGHQRTLEVQVVAQDYHRLASRTYAQGVAQTIVVGDVARGFPLSGICLHFWALNNCCLRPAECGFRRLVCASVLVAESWDSCCCERAAHADWRSLTSRSRATPGKAPLRRHCPECIVVIVVNSTRFECRPEQLRGSFLSLRGSPVVALFAPALAHPV